MAATLNAHGKYKSIANHVIRGGSYETSKTIGKYKVEYDRNEIGLRILIWNPLTPCMAIHVDPEEGATLDLLRYDPTCEVSGKMVKGKGTRDMIQFALDLVKKEGVTKIQLSDYSTFECGGSKISLALFYFILHGKTWYDQYFHFYPVDKSDAEEYERAKQLRKQKLDLEFLKQQTCEYFTQERLKEISKRIEFPDLSFVVWEANL
jgi:hypothetical protein